MSQRQKYMQSYYLENRDLLLARAKNRIARQAIITVGYQKQPNYSPDEIEERLLQAGTKGIPLMNLIKIKLAIAEGEY